MISYNNIMIGVILLIIPLCQGIQTAYPNCLSWQNMDSNDSYSFTENFLTLSSFLHTSIQQQMQHAIFELHSSNNPEPLHQIQHQTRISYIVLGAVMFVLMLSLFVIRLRSPDGEEFWGRRCGKGLICPYMVILGIGMGVFLSFLIYQIEGSFGHMEKVSCRSSHMHELLYGGSTHENWLGLDAIGNHLEYLSEDFLPLFQAVNASIYEVETSALNRRKKQLSNSFHTFTQLYTSASITYGGETVTISTLVPEMFGSTPTLLNDINTSLDNILIITSRVENLQRALESLRAVVGSVREQVSTEAGSYKGWAGALGQVEVMQPTWLQQFFTQYQWVYIVGIELVCIASACIWGLTILTILYYKQKQSMWVRFTRILWGCCLLVSVGCVGILWGYDELGLLSTGYCVNLQSLIHNQTEFERVVGGGVEGLQECLFEREFVTSQYAADHTVIYEVMGNLSLLLGTMDSHSTNFVHGLQYKESISVAADTLRQYQYNLYGSWSYLQSQLAQLNTFTMNDDECFTHHWVFTPQDCHPTSTILSSPYQYSTTYDNVCMCFNTINQHGQIVGIISWQTFMQYYKQTNTSCSEDIFTLGEDIINMAHLQYQTIQPIIGDLVELEGELGQQLQLLRHSMGKQGSYAEMVVGNGTRKMWEEISGGRDRYDCSVVGDEAYNVYKSMCLELRASYDKIYLSLVVLICGLVLLAFGGFFYTFHQAVLREADDSSTQSSDRLRINVDESSTNSNAEAYKTGELKPASIISSEHQSQSQY